MVAYVITTIAFAAVLAACSKRVPSYLEPADYAGCRQAALDHKQQLGTALEQVLAECAKNDPAGYEKWRKG